MDQIQPNLEQMTKQTLTVVQTNFKNLQNSHEEFHRLISYKLQGGSRPIYQRVKNMIDESEMLPQEHSLGQHEEQIEDKQRKHRKRYFQAPSKEEQIRLVRCYRCGTHGHTMKYCQVEVQENKCMFCLGQHSHNNCNTKNCFLCNQAGHIAKQCKAPRIRCRKCGNKGHPEQECGVIVFLNSTGIRFDKQFREQYGMEDLEKIRCLAECKFPIGHFNCQQYEDIRQKFYSQISIERNIVRENFLLSNVKKLREKYFKAQISKETKKSKDLTERRSEISSQGIQASIVEKDDGMEMAAES